ncbi:MAG: hypothetical protein QOD75_2035 [Blastocatellia bacterium]|jgi:hypothetical protein|nr:hypothetical protein [Blastocatellia bacterium]
MDLDYQSLIAEVADCSIDNKIAFLREQLPSHWRQAYERMSSRETSLVCIRHNSFEFVYDNYSYLEVSGAIPYSLIEDRLVAVLGISEPPSMTRDDYRLKGWVGPTERTFGQKCDKGHFIAHSVGGAVDRLEVNVFIQSRDLNRGWSDEGKRYVAMEKYAANHRGTFLFSRPLYEDQTSRPAFLEYGVLKETGDLWVEVFDNRDVSLTLEDKVQEK